MSVPWLSCPEIRGDIVNLTESNQPDAMRAAKYWRERETARFERDEALATVARITERCAQMRLWGDAGRHAATFIENAIEGKTALARPSAPDSDESEVDRLNRAITRVLVMCAEHDQRGFVTVEVVREALNAADLRAAIEGK